MFCFEIVIYFVSSTKEHKQTSLWYPFLGMHQWVQSRPCCAQKVLLEQLETFHHTQFQEMIGYDVYLRSIKNVCVLHEKWPYKDSMWKGNCSKTIHTERAGEGCGLVSEMVVAAGWIWLAACKLSRGMFHLRVWECDAWSPKTKWGTMPRQTLKTLSNWTQFRVDTTVFLSS